MAFNLQKFSILVIALTMLLFQFDANAEQQVVVIPLTESAEPTEINQTLSIPDAAFSANSNSYEVTKVIFGGGAYVSGGSGSFISISAPINLPSGASMNSVIVYYIDDSLAEDLSISIAQTPFDATPTLLRTLSTAGLSNEIRNIELLIDPIIINNNTGGYYLFIAQNNWITEGNDLRIVGAKIEYSYIVR